MQNKWFISKCDGMTTGKEVSKRVFFFFSPRKATLKRNFSLVFYFYEYSQKKRQWELFRI